MRINHVTLLVDDKKRAKKFYTKVLGFRKKEKDGHLWIKVGDEQYIHLTQNSGKPRPDTFYHFAIEIDNLEEYLRKLEVKEVKIIKIGHQNFIKDLDGNLIEFVDSKDNFFK